jgi:hypothetical protein
LITLGNIYTNYQTLEMRFRGIEGKKIVLRGMSTGTPKTVSVKRMERIFIHGRVAYAAKCVITTWRDSDGRQQYQAKIRALLSQHEEFFGPMSRGRPPNRGFDHTIEMDISTDWKSHLLIEYSKNKFACELLV